VGGFAGSIGAGVAFGRAGALPGAFIGGIAAMALVVVIGSIVIKALSRRKGNEVDG
jgi:hypothetical protein